MAQLQSSILTLTNVSADTFIVSFTLQCCVISYWIYVGHTDKGEVPLHAMTAYGKVAILSPPFINFATGWE
jgi:hypothetical protein